MLKQTIILSNHINESEKLKSLALFHKKTINTHYYSALDLARYLLQLSGVVIPQEFITNEEVAARLYKDIKKISYFEKYSFNDVEHLINSLSDLRRYIVEEEETKFYKKLPMDAFIKKNHAITEVYELMMMKLFEENNLIDEVGVIRYALESTKTFKDIEFINYNDTYPLHQALINKAAGKEVTRALVKEDKPLTIASYTKVLLWIPPPARKPSGDGSGAL